MPCMGRDAAVAGGLGRYTHIVETDGNTTEVYDYEGNLVHNTAVGNDGSCIEWAANNIGVDGDVYVKYANYNFNGQTFTNTCKIIAEEGTRFTLTAIPSITTNAEITFDNIEIYSAVDGNGHITIAHNILFKDCIFNLLLDTEAQDLGVIQSNAAAANHIEFRNCTLTGGKAAAEYFVFLRFNADVYSLILRNFTIPDIIANGEVGRISVFWHPAEVAVTHFEARNVLVQHINTTYQGSTFLNVNTGMDKIIFNGFWFMTATWTNGNSYFSPISCFGTAETMTFKDIALYVRSHPVFSAKELLVDGWKHYGDGTIHPGLDLGTSDVSGLRAALTNLYMCKAGICMNSGWKQMSISNSQFQNANIAFSDEGDPTGLEKKAVISNCQFRVDGEESHVAPFLLSYDQGLKLTKLHICNCTFDNVQELFTIPGAPTHPTCIILESCTLEPVINYSRPRIFQGAARDNDNQRVWIFDSELTTYEPPLGDWNPIRPNDRFDNVEWIDTTDSGVTYSENEGVATIPNAAATVNVTHNLVVTPTWALATGTHAEVIQLYITAMGAATFTITTAVGVTSADRQVYWRASVTR